MTGAGPALTGVEIADDGAAWAQAGFAVDGDVLQVGAVRFTFTGTGDGAARGIRRWAFSPDIPHRDTSAPVPAIDGLAVGPGTPAPPDRPAHPNRAVLLDHVVVLSPDVDRTTEAFVAGGLDVRRVRPIPGSEPARVQVFFRAGEVIIELVGSERPRPAWPERQNRGDGPATFYGLAFTVDDLDATAEALGDRLGDIRPAVQPGRRIATLRHRDLGLSVPVAFLSERPPTR